MRLPLLTLSSDRTRAAVLHPRDGVVAQFCGVHSTHGCNYFRCGGLVITCGTVCTADPTSAACVLCLGDAYDACKGCFS
jgi:hypothetical protein